MERPLVLGSIEVIRFIARGGMGAVWAGRDHRSGAEIALKIINRELASDPASVEAFRGEVSSVARLCHPAIVSIYDYGEVSESAAESSGGELVAGSPFLVMEHIDGDSLGERRAALRWPEIRSLTLQVLDALAHTHARDIVHRDLKPGNVMIGEPTPGGGWVKVADFGIAHALDRAGGDDRLVRGTPGYMPPEQRGNHWRAFGPWTDLFALGRIVEELVAAGGAPRALRAWLERMTADDPRRRFARAADAAHALRELGDGPVSVAAGIARVSDIRRPTEVTAAVGSSEVAGGVSPRGRGDQKHSSRPELGPEQHVPPISADWRGAVQPLSSSRFAGIGLWGLRPVPLVARETERDVLWGELRAAAAGAPRAVIIRGDSGVGKSCLARWLCELAHEVGAAETLRASHGPEPHPSHGIAAMLARYFRCTDLPRAEILERLADQLRDLGLDDPHDWIALTELLAPEPGGNPAHVVDIGEQHRVVYRLLCQIAARRPVLVWLDDAHHDRSSARFLRQLGSLPWHSERVLIIATVSSDERLTPELDVAVTEIAVAPLEPADHRLLVRQLLGLEDSLAVRVEALTRGNPLFAEQVVGDLVARQLLETTTGGRFALRPGVELELPDDLHALWTARVERCASTEADLAALELAAVLGGEVDTGEWQRALALSAIEPSDDLVARLVEQRLAEVRPGSRRWSFVNAMVRECLERGARERGRLARHHQNCAELIAGAGGALADERVALHRLSAGDWESAEPLLYSAAVGRHSRGDFQAAQELLAERDAALERAALDLSDRRRIDGWLLQARCGRSRGDLEDAERRAERSIEVARRSGYRDLVCGGLLVLESVHRFRGDSGRAAGLAEEAMALALELDDPVLIADCDKELGWIAFNQGHIDEAIERFERAVGALDADDLDSVSRTTSCLNGIAHAAVQRGDLGRAREVLMQALELHLVRPSSHDAYTFAALGDIERAAGNLDAAELAYRRALERLRGVGYGHNAYPEMNVGLVHLERREFRQARDWFHRALDSFASQGESAVAGFAHAMMLPCLVDAGEWSELDHHLSEAASRLGAGQLADADVAGPLTLAAELALERGEPARARRMLELARDQWRELGRIDKLAELERRLAEIED